MITKKDLKALNRIYSDYTHDQQESSDFKRGVRIAMLCMFDILQAKGKHDTADMLAKDV